MTPLVRPYAAADLAACLAIFDSNATQFFAREERQEFEAFLRALPEGGAAATYLVLEVRGQVLACGGLAPDPAARQASLCWGMVKRSGHGRGLGRALTRARLALARSLPDIDRLTLATSQHTAGFYAGFGFALAAVTPGGFGAGLDRCDMVLTLRSR
jgi:predicted GNAT family N-acyltransferase